MDFLEKCSIHTGVATSDNMIFICIMNDGLAEERQQHAIPLFFKNGAWSSLANETVLPWVVAGMDPIADLSSQIAMVGWGGQALIIDGELTRREALQRNDPEFVSIIRSVKTIADTIYAVGMRRQVYKRSKENVWMNIDDEVAYQGDDIAVGFNTIGGFNVEELYAAGLNGEIWGYDGGKWNEIQSPTNVHLHSICCASDKNVYIGGNSGLFIRGRYNAWDILDSNIEETIWDIHCFGDILYLLTNNGVYRYVDQELEKIKDNLLDYEGFVRISSSNDRLWVFGQKKIVQYDGLSWSEFDTVLPEDKINTEIKGFFNDDVLLSGSDYLE